MQKKSQGLCFGKDNASDQKIYLDNDEVNQIEGTCHMGVPLSPDRDSMKKIIVQRAEKIEKEIDVAMTLGTRRNPLPPLVGKKVYMSLCIPKLMYGLEACVVSEECLITMEKSHRYCARKMQGLPPQTPIIVPLATLGMMTIESMLHCNKMIMLYRWLSLPLSCIYKKVAIARLAYHLLDTGLHMGALYDALQLCRQYGLVEHVVTALETGQTMSLTNWKRLVCEVVKEQELVRWQLTTRLYNNIVLFIECVTSVSVSVWWSVSRCWPKLTKATRVIMRLLCGQHGLATNTLRYRSKGNTEHSPVRSNVCTLCDIGVPETVEHFLFCCCRHDTLRTELLRKLNLLLLPNMYRHMESLNTKGKTVFLLSGMGENFIWEWMDIYQSIAMFVFNMYIVRQNLLAGQG